MDNNLDFNVGKYQDALSDLCGVEYPYLSGDPAVDAMSELITIAYQQHQLIKKLRAEIAELDVIIESIW